MSAWQNLVLLLSTLERVKLCESVKLRTPCGPYKETDQKALSALWCEFPKVFAGSLQECWGYKKYKECCRIFEQD